MKLVTMLNLTNISILLAISSYGIVGYLLRDTIEPFSFSWIIFTLSLGTISFILSLPFLAMIGSIIISITHCVIISYKSSIQLYKLIFLNYKKSGSK